MLQSGVLATVANLADALTRGFRAPGVDGAGPLLGVVAIGSVGTLLLLRLIRRRALHVPGAGRTIRKALPMLPPDVRAEVTVAFREHETLVEGRDATLVPARVAPRVAIPAEVPPYLFVVRQDQPQIFSSLRDLAWSRPDLLGVVFDRRWMGDRRCRREPGSAERRRAERRRAAPGGSWTKLGFLLVRPVAPSRPLPAPKVPPRPAGRAEPARTGATVVSPERTTSVGVPVGPRSSRRAIVLGLGVLLGAGAASAAVLYPERFERLAEVFRAVSSVETPAPPLPAPAPPVAPEPSPPVKAPRRPSVVPPSPEPGSPRAARRDPPAAVATPVAPSEPARGVSVPADRCATPTPEAVALSGREVLGPVVDVKIDPTTEPPRCLYVVEREDGVQWVVDSARVQLQPR